VTLPSRIVVHVGQAKTGSTALQNFLDRNHEILLSQGVLFPRSVLRRSNPTDATRTPGHLDLLGQLRSGETSAIEEELAACAGKIDTLVLSIENIFHYPDSARPLGKWLAGRQVEMLAVLRDPLSWAQALHYEQVMGGINCITRPLERFVEDGISKGLYAYDTVLDQLKDILGASQIHVLDYARHRDGSALIDAAQTIIHPGLSLESETRKTRVNTSLPVPEAIEATRRLNPLVVRLPQALRFEFAHGMRQHVDKERAAGRQTDAVLWLRDPQRRQLAQLAATQNLHLARRMLDGKPPALPLELTHDTPHVSDPARVADLHGAGLDMLVRLWAATPPDDRQSSATDTTLAFDLRADEMQLVLKAAEGAGAILLGQADLLAVLLAGAPGRLIQAPETDPDQRMSLRARIDALALPSGVVIWPGLQPDGYPARTPDLIIVGPDTPPEARACVLRHATQTPKALRLLLANPDACDTGRALASLSSGLKRAGRFIQMHLQPQKQAKA
jgi:hypothetical protein